MPPSCPLYGIRAATAGSRRAAGFCDRALRAVVPASQHHRIAANGAVSNAWHSARLIVPPCRPASGSMRSTARQGTWGRWSPDTAWPARAAAPARSPPQEMRCPAASRPVDRARRRCRRRSPRLKMADVVHRAATTSCRRPRPLGQLRALQRVLQRADRFTTQAVVGPSAMHQQQQPDVFDHIHRGAPLSHRSTARAELRRQEVDQADR